MSMDEISEVGQEIHKIVKTIEAGSGFAVVADEVRRLAMHAAEAAKNSGDLIERNPFLSVE